MVCYAPLKGYRSRTSGDNGRRQIVFNRKQGYVDLPVTVPCGQCVGCRLERSRQWAIRCVHEAQMHQTNSFITLTYNNEHLPKDNSLDLRHFQLFIKRLRKHYHPKPIRFYHCGEYGSKHGRPHYHAILFGLDFEDQRLHQQTKTGDLYTSAILQRLWPYGFSTIGTVTFASAAYVARYIMKKVTGPAASSHYEGRKPEYTTMSRRPGIGSTWLQKFTSDVYPSDEIIIAGKRMRAPKFYDNQYELLEPEDYSRIRSKRIIRGRRLTDKSPERLAVRERAQLARLKLLKRDLDQ